MLYDAKGNYKITGLAVSSKGVEIKSDLAFLYKGTPSDYWTRLEALGLPIYTDISAIGILPDDRFVFGDTSGDGVAYIVDAAMTSKTPIKFTNLEGNTQAFCERGCFKDIAMDGDGRAWTINDDGYIFTSQNSQTTNPGGPMKYVGRLPLYDDPVRKYAHSTGLAFDADGNVYYSVFDIESTGRGEKYTTWVFTTPMKSPLQTTVVVEAFDTLFGDLASCYFPKTSSPP